MCPPKSAEQSQQPHIKKLRAGWSGDREAEGGSLWPSIVSPHQWKARAEGGRAERGTGIERRKGGGRQGGGEGRRREEHL